jgi:tRNA pseudouridine38-40 synthase
VNICLIVEYDGSHFHGWQIQPELKTIEGELNRVLSMLCREEVRCIASGRTDSGVHAKAQVVNFRVNGAVDLARIAHGVSSIMRGELSVVNAAIVPDEFDSRRSARRKEYCYSIHVRPTPPIFNRGRVWHTRGDLDVDLMKTAAEKLVGTHDFASFRDSSCSAKTSIRTVESSVVELDYPYLRYRIVGNGFLKQMVRNIVGTLVLIGRGHLQDIQPILEACDRSQAGPTAPAHGLCLEWVDYNRSEFKPKPLFPEDLFWGQKV